MKKTISIFSLFACLCSLSLLFSCNNTSNKGYEISGSIKGIDSGMVVLTRYNDSDRATITVDSAHFADGKFTLEGQLTTPAMLSLTFKPGNWSLPVFVDNSKITIEADTTGSTHYDWTSYGGVQGAQLKNYKVTGSMVQDEYNQYENAPAIKAFDPMFEKLQQEYTAAGENKEQKEVMKERIDSIRGLMTQKQIVWIDSFVTANPSSATGPYLLQQYYMFNEDLPLKKMESITKKFSGNALATSYYMSLKASIQKRKALQPGNAAPDFTLKKPDSSNFTLSSLKGNYVLLDFWASWCVPCRKAIPHWKEVYAKYHPKGLEIVSVTNDIRWSDWFKALDDEKMPWIQVADEFPVKNMPAKIAELYMIPYLPTYVLLDKDGKIILHNGTEQQIDDQLKAIYGN